MQGLRSQHFEKMHKFLWPKQLPPRGKKLMWLYAVLPTLLLLLVY